MHFIRDTNDGGSSANEGLLHFENFGLVFGEKSLQSELQPLIWSVLSDFLFCMPLSCFERNV